MTATLRMGFVAGIISQVATIFNGSDEWAKLHQGALDQVAIIQLGKVSGSSRLCLRQ